MPFLLASFQKGGIKKKILPFCFIPHLVIAAVSVQAEAMSLGQLIDHGSSGEV